MLILDGVAAVVQPTEADLLLGNHGSVVQTVTEIIRRHPLSERKIVEALSHRAISPEQIQQTLTSLAADRQARRHTYGDEVFWEYVGD